ncbi:MAG: zf-HC2 domain-containing protein [Methylomonas sp.]|jgi:hypothetical protein
MNRTPTPLADQHQSVRLLLPWYLNQSLTEPERRQVAEHLRHCLPCRREAQDLRALAGAVRGGGDLQVAAEASLAACKAKLGHDRKTAGRLKSYAIAASLLLALVPLALKIGVAPAGKSYATLAAGSPAIAAGPHLRVVFAKSLPETQIDRLLAGVRAKRVDAPNSVGAYTVALAADGGQAALADALEFLRRQPEVLLAEPLLER